MADESDLLTLLDLNAGYGGTDCLHDLNASFHRDRCTAIVGASGSGKTTLLRCIAGLLPIRRGQIALAGHRIDPLPPHRRGVSMVFQGLSLYPHWTLRQSIIKARDVKPTKPTRTKDRDSDAFDSLDSLAEAFGIAKILDRKPHAVSGGQRRRAAVVRSLCSGRVLRLWDEPFSALDPPMAAQLAATALANHRRRGAWTLWVTHRIEHALHLADDLIVLDAGRVVFHGTTAGFTPAAIPPSTRPLFASIESLLGEAQQTRLQQPSVQPPSLADPAPRDPSS